jgi:pantoate--beta-alanine ligase
LSQDERKRALALSRGLFKARDSKEPEAAKRIERIRAELKAADAREDYVAVVDAVTLRPIERLDGRPARALVAAFVGTTRLIDNVGL